MLDELLDLFERKSSPPGKRQGGVRGILNRLTGKDESRYAGDHDRRARYDDDDDDLRYRGRRTDDRHEQRRRDDDDDERYASRHWVDDDDDRYPRRRKRRELGDLFDFE